MHFAARSWSSCRIFSIALLPLGLSVFLLSANSFAQQRSATLEIRVVNETDESPISRAEVRLYIFGQGNYTNHAFVDAGGRSTFSGIPAGPYTVEARHPDYEPAQSYVDVRPGQTSMVSVSMHRRAGPAGSQANGAVSSAALNVPASAKKEFESGEAQMSTNLEESIGHFQDAVHLYPKYAEAYVMMALAYLKLNKRSEAAKAVESAIAADPKFNKAYALRGRLLLEDRQFQKAEAALQESIRLDPQAWESHFELARCLYNTARMDEALEQARQARDMPQANPVTHLLLSDIYLKINQRGNALAELEAFVKADPGSPLIPRVEKKIEELRGHP
jgi:cytochrome c-type biogenesis protein CcmH/NrfG